MASHLKKVLSIAVSSVRRLSSTSPASPPSSPPPSVSSPSLKQSNVIASQSSSSAPISCKSPVDSTCCSLSSCPCEAEHGFSRHEFGAEPLQGSVDLYHKHVFICTGTSNWQSEAKDSSSFLRAFSDTMKELKPEMRDQKYKITLSDEAHRGPPGTNDILVFPDMIRINGLQEDDISAVIRQKFLQFNSIESEEISELKEDLNRALPPAEPLHGSWLFVCAHATRDSRCGHCGNALVATLNEYLISAPEGPDLQKTPVAINVRRCSHIGGHKYAGNMIVFRPKGKAEGGSCTGNWYGYVEPKDIPRIVSSDVISGKVLLDKWRGSMGMNPTEQKQAYATAIAARQPLSSLPPSASSETIEK